MNLLPPRLVSDLTPPLLTTLICLPESDLPDALSATCADTLELFTVDTFLPLAEEHHNGVVLLSAVMLPDAFWTQALTDLSVAEEENDEPATSSHQATLLKRRRKLDVYMEPWLDRSQADLLEFARKKRLPVVLLWSHQDSNQALKLAKVTPGDLDWTRLGFTGDLAYFPEHLRDIPRQLALILKLAATEKTLFETKAELTFVRDRFEAISQSSRDFIWEIDSAGHYTYVSEQVRNVLGFLPEEIIGRPMQDFLPEEEAIMMRTKLNQILDTGTPLNRWRHTLHDRNGQQVVLESSGAPITDSTGMILGFRGIDRDVTDQSLAQQALLRREGILRAVADMAQRLLLQDGSVNAEIYNVLRSLGQAARVHRVYLYANQTIGETHELFATLQHEWQTPGILPLLDIEEYQQLDLNPLLGKYGETLENGEPVKLHHNQGPMPVRLMMNQARTQSMLLVPIHIENVWWGFVGLDDCREVRDWSKGELDAMLAATRILGASIQRVDREERLSMLNETFLSFGPDPEANIQLVVELCGRLFGAMMVYYQQVQGDSIVTRMGWQIPETFPEVDLAEGHVAADVARHGGETVIPDISQSEHWQQDPIMVAYQVEAVFGRTVQMVSGMKGALLACFPAAFYPSQEDSRLMAIMASAISVEEERYRSERDLRRMATIIEQASDSICITDLEGKVEYANPATQRLTQIDADQLIGKLMPVLQHFEDDSATIRAIWRQLRAGEAWRGHLTVEQPSGTICYEEAAVTPIRNRVGMITNFVSVERNVTHEMELQEQLRQSQKMESVGRLAGGVAHDFNNLLSIIMGYTDMAVSMIPKEHTLTDMLNEIRNAAKRATSLTQQLLAFSRKQVLEMKWVNVNALIDETRKMLSRIIGEGIQLTVNLDPRLKAIKADESQIQQILLNLVVNARDAMHESGALTIETTPIELKREHPHLSSETEPGDFVCLTVTDTGMGMDSQTMRRIFDPFFTTKEQGKGTGLGLATVHGIVKQHGGEIAVESIPGQGSRFLVYLPYPSNAKRVGDTTVEDSIDCRGNETVLIVEDDINVLFLTQRILQRFGYHVLTAETSLKAQKVAEETKTTIDLLLTDVVMPINNGVNLYKDILAKRADMKVLFMTGYEDAKLVQEEILAKSLPLVTKPFTVNSLGAAVRQAIDVDLD